MLVIIYIKLYYLWLNIKMPAVEWNPKYIRYTNSFEYITTICFDISIIINTQNTNAGITLLGSRVKGRLPHTQNQIFHW